MGLQDTGKLTICPSGSGLVRKGDGSCLFLADDTLLTVHFKLQEFNPGRLHPYGIMERLAELLEVARGTLGVPIIVTSGYRASDDPHGSGLAADVYAPGCSYLRLAQGAYGAGFRRIEVMKPMGATYRDDMAKGGHVHVDVYDGSGNTTAGTMYDCPSCQGVPGYPWYAYGEEGGNPENAASFDELLKILASK